MRKIVAGLFISLDGVVEAPERWGFQYFTEGLSEIITKGVAKADTVLLGPQTYHQFAKIWPGQSDEVPMARFLNESPKVVISNKPETIGDLEWQPATLIKGKLDDEMAKLKAQPGKNIQVPGSPRLVRSLLAEGLLDELYLSICPIVVGSGLKLFDDFAKQVTLEVTESRVFENGLLSVTYQPKIEIESAQKRGFPEAARGR